MFKLDPRILCYQHLLGEHSEMHEGVGLITSENTEIETVKSQLRGQASAGNIDTTWFQPRHDALARELERRGGSHQSPMDYNDSLGIGEGCVEPKESAGKLLTCPDCRARFNHFFAITDPEDFPTNDRGKYLVPFKWYPHADHPLNSELEAVAIEMDDERLREKTA